MHSRDYIQLIGDPGNWHKASVSELEKLVQEFPYFHSAHLMLALASAASDSSAYQRYIRKIAISVPNRERLYDAVNSVPVITAGDRKEEVRVESTKAAQEKKETETLKTESEKKLIEPEKKTSRTEEQDVETEMGKALVASIIEKQVIGVKVEEPNKPTDFASWLAFIKRSDPAKEKSLSERIADIQSAEAGKAGKAKTNKDRQKSIIDKIIETNPGQIKLKEGQKFFKPKEEAKESLLENEHLVTETLAQIYAEQGNDYKAIRAYEILSLKYPQKSAYFASLIQKIKNNQKDQ